MNFQTRPYTQFCLTSTREGASRYAAAITKFDNGATFVELTLSQSDGKRALEHISDVATQFGYQNVLTSFPTSMLALAAPGTNDRQQAINTSVNVLRSADRIDIEVARAHANTYMGNGAFVSPGMADQDIVEFGAVLGDVHPAAHAQAGTLTPQGQIAYMKRVNAEYMGHHLWVSFCPNARRFFRNHSYLFEWRCTVTGEVYRDGPTLLILALQRLRPDTVVDVFKKIEILKALRLKDFNLDLPMLIDSLNEKNDEIQDLDPNAYSETQLASDTF